MDEKQRAKQLETKRELYKEYIERSSEKKVFEEGNQELITALKVIKKDVQRTHCDSHFFKSPLIKISLARMLLIYAMNHPFTSYIQGMNDLIAPIFCVFAGEYFNMSYLQLVNNFAKVESDITGDMLQSIEADAYFCFTSFLEPLKQNYMNDFQGVFKNLEQLQEGLKQLDNKLFQHLMDCQIDILHFAFRWIVCLLMREFPLHLSIKLLDYYLVEECYANELCVYLSLALLLRFSSEMKQMKKEDLITFLQKLPTFDWGEGDIHLLVSESFILKRLVCKN